ncbi:aldehyde dehydrogenase family protein [Streptomyces sp. MBT42]|uniref:aldehyde dehydrogenase family protein n=1 Tax=Streptomyces sp. MBT42 TaxID=1488373 RepID=UPI001E343348|nr:aldehyde dehydrogenase family protein [Streptomyces sp. MBT42]MCD2462494.1 aldehyde dehydrogenase family protein [Streptomyces sp. MBT42]
MLASSSGRATRRRSSSQVTGLSSYGVESNSAHAAFGGYKQSGIGRETHRMMLDHYQQTKNLLVSYSPKKLGFF